MLGFDLLALAISLTLLIIAIGLPSATSGKP